ncbi:MAG: hypothetical protein SNJ78_06400 [Spirochaetales bacterium]
MPNIIVGVMGPGEEATAEDIEAAYTLGREIALRGWVLLTGGRKAGVMEAASKGAFEAGGLVLGVLPGSTREGATPYLTIPIVTGLGEARNLVKETSRMCSFGSIVRD